MAFFLHKCRWKDSFRWHSNSHPEYLLHAHLHYLWHCSGYRDRVCHCLPVIQLHLQKQEVSLHSSAGHRAISCDCILYYLLCRIVRLISPNLNYFIILGAILLYVSVAFFVFPTLDPFLVTFACHVRLTTFNTLILYDTVPLIFCSSEPGSKHWDTSCALVRLLPKCGESTSFSTILKYKWQRQDKE